MFNINKIHDYHYIRILPYISRRIIRIKLEVRGLQMYMQQKVTAAEAYGSKNCTVNPDMEEKLLHRTESGMSKARTCRDRFFQKLTIPRLVLHPLSLA